MRQVLVAESGAEFAERAAEQIAGCLAACQGVRSVASWALSGGSTPRAVYRRLAAGQREAPLDWHRVEFFWGDERCVGPDHRASNFRLAQETLLRPLGIAAHRIHRIEGELEPEIAAERYERELRRLLSGDPPRLDLVVLGLGVDGHTASLFPGQSLGRGERLVIAGRAPTAPARRISMSLRLLNAARRVLFLVAGGAKRELVARILGGTAPEAPAARVQPCSGELVWLLDREASSGL